MGRVGRDEYQRPSLHAQGKVDSRLKAVCRSRGRRPGRPPAGDRASRESRENGRLYRRSRDQVIAIEGLSFMDSDSAREKVSGV